ncbi:PAS domain S-box protein [Methanoregula sp.]|uniref:PAS domain-containing sensor histidine kinase n=1 Tax=Methanoregula sp. TaxID=2052170 RepID=UPI003565ED46
MWQVSPKNQIVYDICIIASTIVATIVTYFCLKNGIQDIFPYLYLIPIVLIAYSRPKFGIYGTILIGWLYFTLVYFWQMPDSNLFTRATIRFYVFVSIGILISLYSQEYQKVGERNFSMYYHSQAGTFIVNNKTLKITDANRKFAQMICYEQSDLVKKNLADILTDPAERELFLSKISDGSRVEDRELRLSAQDGTVRWVIVSASLTQGGEIICTAVDITERKRAEDALQLANKQYDTIVSNIPVGIYTLRSTPEGSYSFDYVSPKLVEMFNVSSISFLADPMLGLRPIHPDDLNALLTLNRETFAHERSPQPHSFEWNGRVITGGATRWIHIESLPVPQENGDVLWDGIVTDITERKRAEDALQQANKQLNLLSSITRHDILNQLMALKGYLYLSTEVIDKPTVLSGYIQKETAAVDTIERQITFTQYYQELGVVAPEWQNVNASIRKAVAGLPMRDIHIEVDPKNPEVFADRLFEKVFYNLIDNALRYGGDQMKTIRVFSQESDRGLRIVCEDDGVGITDEDKKHLFTRGFGKNTGFGLFLSQEILSITGITIAETGIPGKGARFEITVPKGAYRFADIITKS